MGKRSRRRGRKARRPDRGKLYAGGLKGQESQLVLYYDFNEGGPGTRSVKNASPSGNARLEGQLQMDPQRSWVEGKQ